MAQKTPPNVVDTPSIESKKILSPEDLNTVLGVRYTTQDHYDGGYSFTKWVNNRKDGYEYHVFNDNNLTSRIENEDGVCSAFIPQHEGQVLPLGNFCLKMIQLEDNVKNLFQYDLKNSDDRQRMQYHAATKRALMLKNFFQADEEENKNTPSSNAPDLV